MTKGQKALDEIKWYHMDTKGTVERCEIIEKDLNRLEKYDKAKKLIKIKNIDLKYLLLLYHTFPENKLYMYNRDTIKNEQLTQEEFDFILEVFENGN